ncbi:2,3-diaminopropionate biosynthesis protein SbnA [Mesorhizobium sp. WSM3224]|uniref:2,3-diaminopropionate biosynthesis protein SbnA n=1 Tax=Mesorhizobium sp. WSM3224 TaxID=1040986 RepID=UPI00048337D9|nr:2,3-diaminopropionate biosynthesis protein SbnA [Mesorhizobium sp. WSM3224]
MISHSIDDLVCDRVFLDISRHINRGSNKVILKIEGFNPAGSVKIKTARYLLDAVLATKPNDFEGIIESSSGNLGIALAAICAARGIPFECVVDANVLEEKSAQIRCLGAQVTVISTRDNNGGYLGTRIAYIRQTIGRRPGLLWTNQYANEANVAAHYSETAPSIHAEFPALDYLFVGAGTTGTLFGCVKYFAINAPLTKVIAVDAAGSVTFGDRAGKRFIPGIGTSHRPPLVSIVDASPSEVMHVQEKESVLRCRSFSRQSGLLVGGSTGSVITAAERYIDEHGLEDKTIVIIAPDLGHPYLSTIYDNGWVREHFPALSLATPVPDVERPPNSA